MTGPSYAIPQTQNTAPIHEHNCLYTYDIRRKNAKRWQDGYLRFHTFNKRCMLYDVPRNFIGDTHWQESEAIEDGDEIILEKAGVLVQVCERTGTLEADLRGLWEHRKEKEKPHTKSSDFGRLGAGKQNRLIPRSPNSLPKTPRPATGRAILPQRSPYEQRQERLSSSIGKQYDEMQENIRPSKRPRNDENHIPLGQILRTSRPTGPKTAATEKFVDPITPFKTHFDTNRHPTPDRNREPRNLNRASRSKRKQGKSKILEHVDLTALISQSSTIRNDAHDVALNSAESKLLDGSAVANRLGWFSPPRKAMSKQELRCNVARPYEDINNVEAAPVIQELNKVRQVAHLQTPQHNEIMTSNAGASKSKISSRSTYVPRPDTPTSRAPLQQQLPSSPPISTRNRLPPLQEHRDSTPKTCNRTDYYPTGPKDKDKKAPETKPLKVVSRRSHKMLVYQDTPASRITDAPGGTVLGSISKPKTHSRGEDEVTTRGGIPQTGEERPEPSRAGQDKNDEDPTSTQYAGLGSSSFGLTDLTPWIEERDTAQIGRGELSMGEQPSNVGTNAPGHIQASIYESKAQQHKQRERSPLKRAHTIADSAGDSFFGENEGSRQPPPVPRAKQALQRAATVSGPTEGSRNVVDPSKRRTRERLTDSEEGPDTRTLPTLSNTTAQKPSEVEHEQGPWTREAFDLFGEETPRIRQEKSGKRVEWLEKYHSAAVSRPDKQMHNPKKFEGFRTVRSMGEAIAV